MPRPSPLRIALAALTASSLLSVVGCDAEIDVHNAVPRVTWAWVGTPDPATGLTEVVIWVDDIEGDPVDLDVRVVDESGAARVFDLGPGGHGIIGLTTRGALFDPNGQPHTVIWDTSEVTSGTVSLRFTPDDRRGGPGDPMVTPAFPIADGSGDVVRLQPAP